MGTPRRPTVDDRVKFAVLYNLQPAAGIGKVVKASEYGFRIEADKNDLWPDGMFFDVPRCDAELVIPHDQIARELMHALKQIAEQDQAAGGMASAIEQANACMTLARDAVATYERYIK